MPRYRAKAYLFVDNGLIEPGQEFSSDLVPGRNWEPVDAAAKAAVAKMLEARSPAHKAADEISQRIDRSGIHPGTVEIPEDWRKASWPNRRALAMRLGGQGTITSGEANSFIEAELARREQIAA